MHETYTHPATYFKLSLLCLHYRIQCKCYVNTCYICAGKSRKEKKKAVAAGVQLSGRERLWSMGKDPGSTFSTGKINNGLSMVSSCAFLCCTLWSLSWLNVETEGLVAHCLMGVALLYKTFPQFQRFHKENITTVGVWGSFRL